MNITQRKQTVFGIFSLLSILLCIFTVKASQGAPVITTGQPTALPNQNQQSATQAAVAPDQSQQTTRPGSTPIATPTVQTATSPMPMSTPIAAPTSAVMSPMPGVTLDTMTKAQAGTPTQTMPTVTQTQPTATVTTSPPAQISAALAPGQSVPASVATMTPTQNVSAGMTSPSAQGFLAQQGGVIPGPSMPTPQATPAASTAQAIGTAGLSITNATTYPATITLHIMPGNRVIQKDIPVGQSVEILSELSKNDTYTVSGSLFQTVTTKTIVTTLSGPTQSTKPAEFINTKTNRISSTKNWSVVNPTAQKINLTLDFTERQGAAPTFEIRQQ